MSLRHSKDGVITPYSESPFEDGTAKISCPMGCGFLAVAHVKACRHEKIVECPVPRPKEVSCPWKAISGCIKKGNTYAMGTRHTNDSLFNDVSRVLRAKDVSLGGTTVHNSSVQPRRYTFGAHQRFIDHIELT